MSFTQSEEKSFLERLTKIVEANLSNERFGVNELAREMGMSRSNLHRKLKAVTGRSISSFIRKLRLEMAMEMLKQSSTTISEIAFESGFNSVTYFIKCFHDHYGYPPGELRKRESNGASLEENEKNSEVRSTGLGFGKKRFSLSFLVSVILIFFILLVLIIIFKPFSANDQPLDKSIAVLPFINDSPNQDRMYFINGTMEAILDNLCKIEDLRVVSRNSVEQYRNNPKPTPYVAEEMKVNFILEGSGFRDGDDIRLFVQLLDGKKDQHIWSKTYDAQIEEIFSLQSEIAQLVAAEIEAAITPEEKNRIERIPTKNKTAYEFYLRAVEGLWYLADREVFERAFDLLHYAIEYDSTFAYPYAELGRVYDVLHDRNPSAYPNYLDSVFVYANKALSLDDQLFQAYESKGSYYRDKGDINMAVEQFEIALNINPNSVSAYYGLGWTYFDQNDFTNSIENFYKASKLNRGHFLPASLENLGYAYNSAGFPEEFIELLKEALSLHGDSARFYKNYAYAKGSGGNFSEALEAAQKAFTHDPSDLNILGNLMMGHHGLGQYDEAFKYCELYLDRMEALNQYVPYNMPTIIELLMKSGNTELAEIYLEKLTKFDQDKLGKNPLDNLMRSFAVSVLQGDNENAYKYLSEIAQLERLNIWVTTLRTNPSCYKIWTEPEFLIILDKIEEKFQLQRESDKIWLEENDMYY